MARTEGIRSLWFSTAVQPRHRRRSECISPVGRRILPWSDGINAALGRPNFRVNGGPERRTCRESRFEEVYDAIPGPLWKPFRYQLTSRMVRLVHDKPSAKQRLRVSQSDRVPLDRIVTMHAAVSAAATNSRSLGRSANGVQ